MTPELKANINTIQITKKILVKNNPRLSLSIKNGTNCGVVAVGPSKFMKIS